MSPTTPSLERATDFIWANARAIERALFTHSFLGGPAEAVRTALAPYRNPDGGFGQALEPDARAPDSMPLHCEVALYALNGAGLRDPAWASAMADFLDSLAEPSGRVAIVTEAVTRYPHAIHWSQPTFVGDSPNPTASLAGGLGAQGISHPWVERATAWSWARLAQPLSDAHEFVCAVAFLEHASDRPRAEKLAAKLIPQLDSINWFNSDPAETGYGVNPLHVCPRPDSIARPHFDEALLHAHLDALGAKQQDDGGWPINFEPVSTGTAAEWRGKWTLEALETLRAWGRM